MIRENTDPEADSTWRATGATQRAAFGSDSPTLGARVFGGGTARTWLKKLTWLRTHVWQLNPNGCYLELGSGAGPPIARAAALYPARLVVVDPADVALSRSKANWTSRSQIPDRVACFAEELPFADQHFDGVFGIDTLHHFAQPRAAYVEIARVLRPGGTLAFVESNPRHPANLVLAALAPIERGIYRLTPSNLRSWSRQAGLTDPAIDNVATFLPSFPVAASELFDRIEMILNRIPFVRSFATGRTVLCYKPPGAIGCVP